MSTRCLSSKRHVAIRFAQKQPVCWVHYSIQKGFVSLIEGTLPLELFKSACFTTMSPPGPGWGEDLHVWKFSRKKFMKNLLWTESSKRIPSVINYVKNHSCEAMTQWNYIYYFITWKIWLSESIYIYILKYMISGFIINYSINWNIWSVNLL